MTTLEIVEQGTILPPPSARPCTDSTTAARTTATIMAVFVEPPEYLIGLRLARKQGVRNPYRFEHWVERTQPEGARSGPGIHALSTLSKR